MGQLFARETLDMSNLIRFLKKSVGKKLTAVLFATSCLFSLLKLSNMILPFFAEKFIDGVQRGLFESTYLFVAASLYVVSFVLQSIVSFIYGREQIKAKNVLQLHIMNSILHQNPFYIKSKGEGFFSNLLDNSIDTIMNVIAPYNIYTMFLIVQNVIIVVIMYCKSISAGILCTGLFLLHFLAYIMNSRLFSTVLADFIERTNSSMAVTYDFIRGNKSLVASENAISFANDKQPYGDSFKEKYEKLNKLFTCKKVDFLLINYRDIVDEVNNLTLIEEEFLDWLKNQEEPMPEKYKNVIPNTVPPKTIPVRIPIDLCDF